MKRSTLVCILALCVAALAGAAPNWLFSPGSLAVSRRIQALRADPDRDGLDAWAESRAGTCPTNADTAGDGYSDYYSRTNASALTWGELYDDGDGMPNDWEASAGLDPDRFDANDDPDADGWTNWEEWMAGTDPRSAASAPAPRMAITLDYGGTQSLDRVIVQSYSARVAGSGFGGRPDGEYSVSSSGGVSLVRGGVRGGWNRFFAFSDLNGNGTFDEGEPAGLSPHESMVSYDTAQISIPLVDELFGFPRISWAASTNSSVTCYVVSIANSGGRSVVGTGGITVEAPRTFLHEGDFIMAGIEGIDFVGKKQETFTWTVMAKDDSGTAGLQIASGVFSSSFCSNSGLRRALEAIAPVSGATVFDKVVEFRWKMDWRTEGVFITVKKNNVAVTGLDSLYVPFPVRHGDPAFPSYYYTAVPQIEGRRSPIQLSPGTYTYTITENLRTTALTAQSVSGSFVISDPASSRLPAISGRVIYWGRAVSVSNFPASCVVQAFRLPDGATSGAAPSGFPVAQTIVGKPGEFTLTGLSPGLYAVRAFLDQNSNRDADDWETQGYGVLAGTASPVFYATPQPLVVSGGDLEGVAIVLHPRDTDNDGLDDDWEWAQSGNLTTKTGTAADLAAFAADPVPGGQPFVYGE